jgi:16S rRNA (cytosine1402-N4)-methyltransferase
MSNTVHQSVLLKEALDALAVKKDGIYIDATFGRGGHSRALLERLDKQGCVVAMDRDPQAIAYAKEHFSDEARFAIYQSEFAELRHVAEQANCVGQVDGILFDCGVSSPQLDEGDRGFSFTQDGPLDMRMDPDSGISAADWIASVKETDLANVLYEYGEERFSRRIAKAIVAARQTQAITSTLQLADIVAKAHPKWEVGKHPATRSFQAIRIFINQELSQIETALEQTLDVLKPGGRLVVISFHSLEDRLVKRFLSRESKGKVPAKLAIPDKDIKRRIKTIGKAVRASTEEINNNRRARSAILRIGEKLA